MEEINEHAKRILSSKGLIVAAVIVVITAVVGVSALFGMSSSENYQGLIKKLEKQTEILRTEGVNNILREFDKGDK